MDEQYKRNLRQKILISIMILLTLATGISLSMYMRSDLKGSNIGLILPMGLILMTIGVYIFAYLESKSSIKSFVRFEDSPSLGYNFLIKDLEKKIEKVNAQLDNISKATSSISLQPEERAKLFQYIEHSFSNSINQNLFNYLEAKYEERSKEVEKFQEYLVDFTNIKNRISTEIKKLSLRANLNLAIGSVTTIAAVSVLYMTVTNDKVDFTNTVDLLGHFIPRITVVIFIEVFAFFFLKLYRNNIDSIKYYHNELTNVDLKLVSLKQAVKSNNTEAINSILAELSKTERNFIIKKDETTIELERMKQDGDANKSVVAALTEVLKIKR